MIRSFWQAWSSVWVGVGRRDGRFASAGRAGRRPVFLRRDATAACKTFFFLRLTWTERNASVDKARIN